uniref:Uncharacterized protein n=1 Tax=Arundo donax TaxID=35708 RepID=A0A0A9FH72_ARUDO
MGVAPSKGYALFPLPTFYSSIFLIFWGFDYKSQQFHDADFFLVAIFLFACLVV